MPIGKRRVHDMLSPKLNARKKHRHIVALESSRLQSATPPTVDQTKNTPVVAKPRNIVTLQEKRDIAQFEGAPIVNDLNAQETLDKNVAPVVKQIKSEPPIDFSTQKVGKQKDKKKGGRPKKSEE
jgi:hypothetical protein